MSTGNTCLLLALSVTSIGVFYRANEDTRLHIQETIYFINIFLIQQIHSLHDRAHHSHPATQQLHDMVLATLVYWVDTVNRDLLSKCNFILKRDSLCHFKSLFDLTIPATYCIQSQRYAPSKLVIL